MVSRKVAGLNRFFLATTIMLLSGKALRLFSYFMGDKSKGISEFQSLLVYSNVIWAVIAVFAVITALLYLAAYRFPYKTMPIAIPIIIGSILFFLFVQCFCGVLFQRDRHKNRPRLS